VGRWWLQIGSSLEVVAKAAAFASPILFQPVIFLQTQQFENAANSSRTQVVALAPYRSDVFMQSEVMASLGQMPALLNSEAPQTPAAPLTPVSAAHAPFNMGSTSLMAKSASMRASGAHSAAASKSSRAPASSSGSSNATKASETAKATKAVLAATTASTVSGSQSAAENNAPIAVSDSFSIASGVILNINISSELLANDTDGDNDTLTLSDVNTVSTAGGTVVNNGNGTITYTPAIGFSGADEFNYELTDGNSIVVGTVLVDVVVVNSPILAESVNGTTINSATVSTTAAVAASVNRLYVAFVSGHNDGVSVVSVAGAGLAWQFLARQCSAAGEVTPEAWYAVGNATNTTVTATFSGVRDSAQIAVVALEQFDASDPIGVVSSANAHGVGGNCAVGVSQNNHSFAVTGEALGSRVLVASAFDRQSTSMTNSSGTLLGQWASGSNPRASNLAIQHALHATGLSGTYSGNFSNAARWSSIAIEIRPSP